MPRSIDAAFLTPPNDQLKPRSGDNSYRASASTELICDVGLAYMCSHPCNDSCSPTETETGLGSHTKPYITAAKYIQNDRNAVYGPPILTGVFAALGSFLYGYDLNIMAEGKPFTTFH